MPCAVIFDVSLLKVFLVFNEPLLFLWNFEIISKVFLNFEKFSSISNGISFEQF